jgi:hypothetical protein
MSSLGGVDVLVAEPVGLAMRVLHRQAGRWINWTLECKQVLYAVERLYRR